MFKNGDRAAPFRCGDRVKLIKSAVTDNIGAVGTVVKAHKKYAEVQWDEPSWTTKERSDGMWLMKQQIINNVELDRLVLEMP